MLGKSGALVRDDADEDDVVEDVEVVEAGLTGFTMRVSRLIVVTG
jgi:hypothetical protein